MQERKHDVTEEAAFFKVANCDLELLAELPKTAEREADVGPECSDRLAMLVL